MAKVRQADSGAVRLHRVMNTPGPFLRGMLVFLALVGFIVAIVWPHLVTAFWTNPLLNGLIVGVLVVGIVRAFGQVVRLYPEIRWVNAFRIADPGLAIEHKPVLLAPMATMLRDRRGQISLSASSMRSLMDSLGGRLDESRDTGRYLVGLLVFLGLLGTFWGLLDTMQSVGRAINALDTKQQDTLLVFEELKQNLAAPLKGMGTAFSSSLMGLAGSLVLGFLDLQTSHAHNRFYNELEEWLSGITELTPAGTALTTEQVNRQLTAAVYDMQRAVAELTAGVQGIAAAQANGAGGAHAATFAASEQAVRELAQGVDQLVHQMRAEQKVVREWVDEQAARQSEMSAVLKDLAQSLARRGG
jgi:hypothetical protein